MHDDAIDIPKGLADLSPGKCEARVGWDGTPTFLHATSISDKVSILESSDCLSETENISLFFSKPSE